MSITAVMTFSTLRVCKFVGLKEESMRQNQRTDG